MDLQAQLDIQRHAKVLRGVGVKYGFAIHSYRYMMISFVSEGYVERLVFVELISHCRVQSFISSAALCNFSVASTTSPPTAVIEVSSAKVATVVPSSCGRSLVYRRYKTGPSTLPCGTPALMGLSPEYSLSCLTRK